MAQTNYNTDATSIKLSKVKAILATPWSSGAKGEKTYKFDNVLKDSTSITQDDPTTNDIENEVSDSPIVTNTTLGKWNFASTIEDVQKELLKEFCGYTVKTDKVLAPASYITKYAEIVVVMDGGDKNVAFVLPKVQLNSKMLIESLSTNMAGFNLSGAAQNATIESVETPFYVDTNYTMPTTFVSIA